MISLYASTPQWLGTVWYLVLILRGSKVVGRSAVKVTALSARRPSRSHWRASSGSVGVYAGGERERKGDGNEGANCFQWILKSNLSPQCMDLAARKWNIDDYGENKGKWLRYTIDLKATDLCRTCLNRQYVSPGLYGSVYTYHKFNTAEVHRYYIILICSLCYSQKQCYIDNPYRSTATK